MKLPQNLLHAIAGLLAAVAGGLAFDWLGVPLPYILGAMAGSALYGNVFNPLKRTRYIRRFGQVVIGTAVAAILTPAVIADLGRLFPLMLGAAIGLNVMGAVLAIPIARIAGADRLTGLLACLPAGMTEMATLARDLRAEEHVVALIHTLRVIFVVSLIPFLVGVAGAASTPAVGPADLRAMGILAAFFAAGALLAVLAERIGLLNPWVIAPMALGLVIVAFGGSISPVPIWLLVAAQLAIGASLGSRFRVQQLKALPRATLGGIVSALVLIAFAPVGLATLLAATTPLDFRTLALSLAPGGLGEMIASAKALGIASAIVAGFQFVRTAMTNLLVPLIIRYWVGRRRKPD